eukprot:167898-Amorphochlora_amoeboformis.AAC.1
MSKPYLPRGPHPNSNLNPNPIRTKHHNHDNTQANPPAQEDRPAAGGAPPAEENRANTEVDAKTAEFSMDVSLNYLQEQLELAQKQLQVDQLSELEKEK